MNEREQPVVDLGETDDAVLISAADFEGCQLDAACDKAVSDARFTDAVLPPEPKADRTDWHVPSSVIVLARRAIAASRWPIPVSSGSDAPCFSEVFRIRPRVDPHDAP